MHPMDGVGEIKSQRKCEIKHQSINHFICSIKQQSVI